jgi:acyl-CoA thioesterase
MSAGNTSKNFEQLTQFVTAGAHEYGVEFDDQTTLWSVNGGYIGAIAMRIAGHASKFTRPTNVSCQFIRTCKPGPASATVSTLASNSSAELVQIDFHQDGKHCAVVLVWTIDRKNGPNHSAAQIPSVPHPEELRSLEEVMRADEPPVHKFWSVYDQRPINRIGSRQRSPRSSRFLRWFRYRDPVDGTSQFLTAAKYLPTIDVLGVTAAAQMYDEPFLRSLAPTIQLAVHFYDISDAGEWFLCDAFCEHTNDGLIPARVKVWSVKGQLLAHGFSQMVTREGSGAYVGSKTG